MSDSKPKPSGTSAQTTPPSPTTALVEALAQGLGEQVGRALDFKLADEPAGLAFVDHYLGLLRDEDREPIIALVAAQAGAWFGELVRREIGAIWIGDGREPRRLRLLIEPAFVHFSPVDMAYEAIFSGPAELGDPRLPTGAEVDGAFHLRKRPAADTEGPELSEQDWIKDRLAAVAPLPEDQFYSLTGRFETLKLIVELLAGRRVEQGDEPTPYHLNDYVAELTAVTPEPN